MSNADELQKLKNLLDNGAINEDEFQIEKNKLIGTDKNINNTENIFNEVKRLADGKDLSSINGTVKFVLGETIVRIDGPSGVISKDNSFATCTVTTNKEIMQSIIDGSSSIQEAFMSGNLKLDGANAVKIANETQSVIFDTEKLRERLEESSKNNNFDSTDLSIIVLSVLIPAVLFLLWLY